MTAVREQISEPLLSVSLIGEQDCRGVEYQLANSRGHGSSFRAVVLALLFWR